jgi:hypothetical protein
MRLLHPGVTVSGAMVEMGRSRRSTSEVRTRASRPIVLFRHVSADAVAVDLVDDGTHLTGQGRERRKGRRRFERSGSYDRPRPNQVRQMSPSVSIVGEVADRGPRTVVRRSNGLMECR